MPTIARCHPPQRRLHLKRTSHGSTLSGMVNAWVLARCDQRRSWRFFTEALASDVHDVQGGTTAEGIHLGAMAGTVDLAQRCYTGLEAREDVLWLNPSLPQELDGLDLDLRYRGHWGINLHLIRRRLRVQGVPPGSSQKARPPSGVRPVSGRAYDPSRPGPAGRCCVHGGDRYRTTGRR